MPWTANDEITFRRGEGGHCSDAEGLYLWYQMGSWGENNGNQYEKNYAHSVRPVQQIQAILKGNGGH